jgi:hypothetical protein
VELGLKKNASMASSGPVTLLLAKNQASPVTYRVKKTLVKITIGSQNSKFEDRRLKTGENIRRRRTERQNACIQQSIFFRNNVWIEKFGRKLFFSSHFNASYTF